MSLAWVNTFLTNQFGVIGTRDVLLFGTFISEAAVAIGIILEAPKEKTRKDWAAIVIVVGGVCLGMLFTIDLFAFDEGISSAQQTKKFTVLKRRQPQRCYKRRTPAQKLEMRLCALAIWN